MTPRVLFASLSVPGMGGSSTAAYDLFSRMADDGGAVQFLNLVETQRAPVVECTYGPTAGNPRGLPNVHTHWFPRALQAPQPELSALVDALDPEVIIGVGWIAAGALLRAAPGRRTALLTGSCRSAQDYVTSGRAKTVVSLIDKLRGSPGVPLRLSEGERDVYESCDLVLAHSSQTLELVQRFFPRGLGKIYPEVFWFAEWICDGARVWAHRARRFEHRDIDVLFIATSWSRREKNYPLVKALCRRFRGAAVHVVGEASGLPRSVTHHGFIAERERLFELLGRARCVVCPSLMDAAPGILFEAAVLGCNLVASRNCGNWELCHPDLLADPFEPGRFADCIERAMRTKYEDRLDRFLVPSSYQNLVRTIAAFARPFEARLGP